MLEPELLRNDIQRPPLHLRMDAADIEAHYSGHEHVDAAKERDDNDS